jgi:hypothetical protein
VADVTIVSWIPGGRGGSQGSCERSSGGKNLKQPVFICDVCGLAVTTYSIIEATAGPIRSCVHTPIALCPLCCDQLRDWIRGVSPDLTQQDGQAGALADTAAPPRTELSERLESIPGRNASQPLQADVRLESLSYVTDVTIVNSIPGIRVSRLHERSFRRAR